MARWHPFPCATPRNALSPLTPFRIVPSANRAIRPGRRSGQTARRLFGHPPTSSCLRGPPALRAIARTSRPAASSSSLKTGNMSNPSSFTLRSNFAPAALASVGNISNVVRKSSHTLPRRQPARPSRNERHSHPALVHRRLAAAEGSIAAVAGSRRCQRGTPRRCSPLAPVPGSAPAFRRWLIHARDGAIVAAESSRPSLCRDTSAAYFSGTCTPSPRRSFPGLARSRLATVPPRRWRRYAAH